MDENADLRLVIETARRNDNFTRRCYAYELALEYFVACEDDSYEMRSYCELIPEFLEERNEFCLTKALNAVRVYVNRCVNALTLTKKITRIIVEKILMIPSDRVHEIAVDILLDFIELEGKDVTLRQLIAGALRNGAPLSNMCIQVIRYALQDFGPHVISITTLINFIEGLVRKNMFHEVQKECSMLMILMYQWMGPQIGVYLEPLLDADVLSAVEDGYERVKDVPMYFTRFVRYVKENLEDTNDSDDECFAKCNIVPHASQSSLDILEDINDETIFSERYMNESLFIAAIGREINNGIPLAIPPAENVFQVELPPIGNENPPEGQALKEADDENENNNAPENVGYLGAMDVNNNSINEPAFDYWDSMSYDMHCDFEEPDINNYSDLEYEFSEERYFRNLYPYDQKVYHPEIPYPIPFARKTVDKASQTPIKPNTVNLNNPYESLLNQLFNCYGTENVLIWLYDKLHPNIKLRVNGNQTKGKVEGTLKLYEKINDINKLDRRMPRTKSNIATRTLSQNNILHSGEFPRRILCQEGRNRTVRKTVKPFFTFSEDSVYNNRANQNNCQKMELSGNIENETKIINKKVCGLVSLNSLKNSSGLEQSMQKKKSSFFKRKVAVKWKTGTQPEKIRLWKRIYFFFFGKKLNVKGRARPGFNLSFPNGDEKYGKDVFLSGSSLVKSRSAPAIVQNHFSNAYNNLSKHTSDPDASSRGTRETGNVNNGRAKYLSPDETNLQFKRNLAEDNVNFLEWNKINQTRSNEIDDPDEGRSLSYRKDVLSSEPGPSHCTDPLMKDTHEGHQEECSGGCMNYEECSSSQRGSGGEPTSDELGGGLVTKKQQKMDDDPKKRKLISATPIKECC